MKKSKIILLLCAMLMIVSLCAVACGPQAFKVTFDGNGGTLVSGTEIQEVKSAKEIVAPVYEKVGYTLSWDKDLASIKEETTVTAVWTANEYQITFNLNDSVGSPATLEGGLTKNYAYDAAMALPTPVRAGYTFGGWKKGSAEGTDFADGTVLNETAGFTLYASWTVNTYTVTFDLNDSVNAPAEMEGEKVVEYVYDGAMALPTPTRVGYIFSGWKKGSATGEALTNGQANKYAEDFTAYASWVADSEQTFAIAYDLAGGTLAVGSENPAVYSAADETFTLNNPVKPGFRFMGWKEGTADPVKTVTIEAGSVGARSFTAVWEQIVYTIDFVLTGTDKDGNPYTITIGGANDIANVIINCGEYLGEKLPVAEDFDPIENEQREAFDGWKVIVGGQVMTIDGNTVFTSEIFGEADVVIQVIVKLVPVWSGIH